MRRAVSYLVLTLCLALLLGAPPSWAQTRRIPVPKPQVEKNRRSIDLRLRQARILQNRGELARAEEILRELLQQRPHDPRIVRQLGSVLEAGRRYEEAVALYEGEIQAGKNPTLFLMDIASAYQRAGQARKVLETLFRYLELYPGRTRWARDILETMVLRGQMDDETMAYLESEARRRRSPELLSLAADLYVYADRPAEAIQLLEEADRTREAHGEVLFPLAKVLVSRDRPEEALEVIRRVLALGPNEGLEEEAWLLKARLLRDQGALEEAVAAYEELTQRFPEGFLLRRALMEEAEILKDRLGRLGPAREVLRRLVASLEASGSFRGRSQVLEEAWLSLGECALWEGAWDEAESTFTRVLEEGTVAANRQRAAYLLAEARLYQGDYPGAESAFYAVADSFPGGEWANDALDRILFLQEHALAPGRELGRLLDVQRLRYAGRVDSALALVGELRAAGVDSVLQDDLLAETVLCLLASGQGDSARAVLATWPEAFQDGRLAPRSWFQVARWYETAGRREEAMELYEDLILRFPDSLEGRRSRIRLEQLREAAS
jgi:tetratricopeptide (TPR) repeat protein